MTELFKLLGTIAIDNSEANEALNETSSKGEQSESKLSSAFSKIGSAALKVGKAIVSGLAAGAAGVAALVGKSVQSYADYEQLVGGVDTLFKNSSAQVQKYAQNAYKTAGMSANDYMETVTGFSASLLQSLGGDTAKAAKYADTAITDMSDNANKMGTDMESIKNAYQGFAKQNYTMLDNLKLGYGGTKEEMARLLKDAQKISGVKYDLSSYSDVVQAIHVMQEKMGIAGTTSKEAASTISGSISSMKGAWQNLLTAISSDDLPFDDYVKNFVDSFSTVATNLLPRIKTALNGVVTLVQQLAPKIIAELPGVLSTLLPAVINAATSLITAIAQALPGLIDVIVASAPAFINGFVQVFNAIVTALPTIFASLVSALPTLLPLLIDGLVSMIVTLCSSLPQMIQPIIDNLPTIIISIITALTENLPILIEGVVTLILGLVEAMPQIIQALVDCMPMVIESLVVGIWNALPALIVGFVKLVQGVVEARQKIWGSLEKLIPKIFEGILNSIKKIFTPLANWFSDKFNDVKQKVSAKVQEIKTNVVNKFNELKSGVADKISNIKTSAVNKFNEIKSGITNKVNAIKTSVTDKFNAIKNSIVDKINNAKDKVKSVVDKIKGFFNFKVSLPKIKLPHFSIKPKGWEMGDLLKGKIPKLGISWYAKAMNNPVIMDKPTVFGYDASTGNLLGGGEAGSEVVSGTNTLMNMIQNAVAEQNVDLAYYIQKLIEMLATYFPQILDSMDRDIVMDSGALVGSLAVPMDEALGRLQIRKDRGR